jgi:hypothetical protein
MALAGAASDSLATLRELGADTNEGDVATLLRTDRNGLEICRLLLGHGRTVASRMICRGLGFNPITWSRLEAFAWLEPELVSHALFGMGLRESVRLCKQAARDSHDMVARRLEIGSRRLRRNRRPPLFENMVASWLQLAGIMFEMNAPLTNKDGRVVFADFAIPDRYRPRVVAVAKPFDAVANRMDGFFKMIHTLAIGTRDRACAFFVITDGIGWKTRVADLSSLVGLQNEGLIERIFTLRQMSVFVTVVKHFLMESDAAPPRR